MLTIGFSFAAPVTSKAVPSLFLASSVCKSLQCLISTLTQGVTVVTYLGSVVHLHCGDGGALQTNIAGCVGALAVCGPHWLCPRSRRVCFPGLHCSGSRVPCRETVSRGPWVACAAQVQAAGVQVRGYSAKAQALLGLHFVPAPSLSSSGDHVLGNALSQVCSASTTSLIPAAWFPGCPVRGVPCVSSGELISDCNPPGRCQLSRISGRLG